MLYIIEENMQEKEFYTVEELAKKFDRTPYTIRVWLRQGLIKGKRIGKHWYVPKENIKDIFKEG